MTRKNRYPEGWSESRVRRVLSHYEHQTEDAAVTEDETAFKDRTTSSVRVPVQLLPDVRRLVARFDSRSSQLPAGKNIQLRAVERAMDRQGLPRHSRVSVPMVGKFLAELDQTERLILVLYYYEELTMKEIAEMLGLSASAVGRAHKAMLGYLRNWAAGIRLGSRTA